MQTWNALSSALFDALLAPFGHGPAWFDLVLWPVLAGVLALVVYKHLSNQQGIARAKNRIAAHLYEIRLFRHDPIAVIVSTGKIFFSNAIYLGHNLVPLAVLLVPMMFWLASGPSERIQWITAPRYPQKRASRVVFITTSPV